MGSMTHREPGAIAPGTPPHPPPVLSLVGDTPLVPLTFADLGLTVYAKCEFLNPSGSIKDRFARLVLMDAWQRGELNADSIIVECSSGNTGIALAMAGAVLGCQVMILMSESASVERRHLIRQLGAGIRVLPAGGTYQDGIDLSRQMAAADPRIFLPRQFENPLNTEDHRQTTGMEILRQMEGRVDAFVSGYGTGGTLSGCGLAIKSHSRSALVVAMRPRANAALPGFGDCCFCIEGVAGHGFVPALLKQAPVDQTVEVDGLEALAMTRRLHRDFGLLVGTSSGANVLAALAIARELGPSARVVTVLCDRAERYFSTRLFE